MPILNDWLACQFAYIACHLPRLVEENASSFDCGHKMGYKHALIDLVHYLEELEEIEQVPKHLFISDVKNE
jgi:hypothetical protein